jgi:hypothetical protein
LPRSGKRNLLAETAPTLDSDSRKCDSLGANYEKGFRAMFRGPFSFVVTSIVVGETLTRHSASISGAAHAPSLLATKLILVLADLKRL